MPAPGNQHANSGGDPSITTNPFIEVQPRISTYTAVEIATLQSRLEKQLGPEFLSSRPNGGAGRVHYLAADKAIQLANDVFGFNGWSSQIMKIEMDFMDESNSNPVKYTMGLSVIVRVTLKDGTFHEDIGYGSIENCKSKAQAFEKAKKEGTTDALKRALRNFGNLLGNCIYDKDYVAKVSKLKVKPSKFDPDTLHRHSEYAPVKRDSPPVIDAGIDAAARISDLDTKESMDDEFGEFDEADFSAADPDTHPDEIVVPNHISFKPARPPLPDSVHSMPAPSRITVPQIAPSTRYQQPNLSLPVSAQPRTPNAGLTRSSSITKTVVPPTGPSDTGANILRIQPLNGLPQVRKLNQPSRNTAATISAPPSPKIGSLDDVDDLLSLPTGPPTVGFFSAKAAAILPEGVDAPPLINAPDLPTFNPHLESPSIRRTAGVDHKSSKPLSRDLKPVSSTPQAAAGNSALRNNIINPQLENTRRIGQPGSPSLLTNRNSYKPPTIKRPIDTTTDAVRPPLIALNSNGQIGTGGDIGSDLKRPRIA